MGKGIGSTLALENKASSMSMMDPIMLSSLLEWLLPHVGAQLEDSPAAPIIEDPSAKPGTESIPRLAAVKRPFETALEEAELGWGTSSDLELLTWAAKVLEGAAGGAAKEAADEVTASGSLY